MTPLERATQAIQSITVFWDETYDGAFVVTGDPTRYATNAEAQKAQARAQARAVIAAIREPSEAVLQTMRDTVPVDGLEWDYVDADAAPHWRAMSDVLLA